MQIKINSGNCQSCGRPIQGNQGVIYFKYELDEVSYFHENQRFIFFIDTNLSKEKAPSIYALLDTLDNITHQVMEPIFHGNYFIVAIDKRTTHIHILRDACGVKTGYFTKEEKTLVIGSVMHQIAKEKQALTYNKEAIGQLLYAGYLLDGYTLYESVEEVKMGHHLTFDNYLELLDIQKDTVQLATQDNQLSEKENCTKLRKETQKAHAGYLGNYNRVFLSGGLDSIAMLIAMDDLDSCKNLDSISFRVKGTTQDETIYAKSIAEHLQIKNSIKNIDANDAYNIKNFEEKVLEMNNPYFGTWIFGNFNGNTSQMYYAGQDTRLHTPALNEIDKWAFNLINHQDAWWMKYVAKPIAGFAKNMMEKLGCQKGETMIQRNLYKLCFIFDLENYVRQFYLKLDKTKMAKKGIPTDYYDQYQQQFDFDFSQIESPRHLYNRLVELKWKEQYVYDMRYLQDVARINNTYIAMPFYNKSLAEFSSSIPFSLSTKPMLGTARFGKKRHIIYKYVLRHAFRDKLNDLTFYRAKAVSQTLHQLFNGALGAKVRYLLERDLDADDSFIRQFNLELYVNKFLKKEKFGMEDDDLMARVYYIATLTVYHRHVYQVAQQKNKNFAVATAA